MDVHESLSESSVLNRLKTTVALEIVADKLSLWHTQLQYRLLWKWENRCLLKEKKSIVGVINCPNAKIIL